MAVARRVLAEVVPVPFFGRPETLQGLQFRHRILSEALLLPGEFRFDYRPLGRVGVEDARAVARADVVTLTVYREGVDAGEEKPHKLPERHPRGVIDDLHRLGVACGIGIDLFVGRLVQGPVSIARHSGYDAVHTLEKVFGAPEATACKIDSSVTHKQKTGNERPNGPIIIVVKINIFPKKTLYLMA